jgi:hypothetical protein
MILIYFEIESVCFLLSFRICQPTSGLTFEFLILVFHTMIDNYSSEYWKVLDHVYFRLLNRECEPSPTEWYNCFGLTNNLMDIRCNNFFLNPTLSQYFDRMSRNRPSRQGNNIECPSIRYLCYVIANTLQARGEFTRLNKRRR